MDALSQLLTLNNPQGSIDKNCPLGGDWQLPHAAGELSVIRWHTVTQGEALLEMPAGDAITLMPGNVVILPQNSAHRLRQAGKAPTHIVCGSLRLHTTSRYFLTALPEVLYFAPQQHSPVSIWLNAALYCYSRSQIAIYPALTFYAASNAPLCLPSPFATGCRRRARRKAC